MLGAFLYILEVKKEFLVCLSLLYLAYYLVEVVQRPRLFCGEGEFRRLLEGQVPLLRQRYWPPPWCVEARLQTVLGALLRERLMPPAHYRREVLRLADGGQVALDWAQPEPVGAAPLLLVLPGLAGGAQADYARCLAAAAAALGARCVVYHYRGLGGLPLATPRLYCALSHDDLAEVVEALAARAAPLLVAGVSLGGLMLAHYLAEGGESAARRVRAALAVSPPLDVERGAEGLARGLNAALSWHMARSLRRTVRALGPREEAALRGVRSLRAFDEAFTARHFGFASAADYYRAATLRGKLRRVRAPLLCLQAADDPFQPLAALPLAEAAASARVALAVTARGGHIGFLEGRWPAPPAAPPGDAYIARLATQYFGALLRSPLDS